MTSSRAATTTRVPTSRRRTSPVSRPRTTRPWSSTCAEALRDAALLRLLLAVHADPQGEGHEGRTTSNHPLATGPYMFDTYTPGTELELKKNPNWDPNTDPARHQYAGRLPLQVGRRHHQDPAADPRQQRRRRHQRSTGTPIDSSLIPQVDRREEGPVRSQGPSSCTALVNLDTRKIPLQVRKAIAVAYPFDYDPQGRRPETMHSSAPASTIIPPQVPGHLDYTPLPGLTGKGEGDAATAKKMLADAGKAGSFELDLLLHERRRRSRSRSTRSASRRSRRPASRCTDIGVPGQGASCADRQARTRRVNMLQGPGGWCFDWPTADAIFPPTVRSIRSCRPAARAGATSDRRQDRRRDRAHLRTCRSPSRARSGASWTSGSWRPTSWPARLLRQGQRVFGTKVKNVDDDPNKGMPYLDDVWLDK